MTTRDLKKRRFTLTVRKKSVARRVKRKARVDVDREAGRPRRNDLLPDLRFSKRPIAELKLARRNVRALPDDQLRSLVRSLRKFGQVLPVLIDQSDRVVAGHGIVAALQELGIDSVNCVVLDHLSEDECRLLRLALNRLGETGDWNIDNLREEMIELDSLEFDLEDSGFTLEECDLILMDDQPDPEADTLPEPDDVIVSRLGDMWRLSEHLLLCGDALDEASYATLLGTETAATVFTDPPYNIPIAGVVSGLGKVKHSDFAMACGEMSDAQFRQFLSSWMEHCRAHCSKGAVMFACMDWRQQHLLRLAGEDAGLTHINTAAWDKGSGGMGPLYRSAHEFVLVFCNGKSPATNNVQLGKHGRDRTNVWQYPGANKPGSSAAKVLKDHATPKPVELVQDALLDVSKRGDIVLDPFMGSGTTIIAAESCGRIARGIELEPKFVDVAVRRWEEFTGANAINVATGKTFAEHRAAQLASLELRPVPQSDGGQS